MQRKVLFLIIAIVGIGAAFTLIANRSAKDTEFSRRMGFIGPLSGEASDIGSTILKVAEMAIDEVNARKINNMFDLIVEDGKCSGKDALSAAQKLIFTNKVKVIIFGGCSGEVLAVAPLLEKEKVLGIATIAGSPDVSTAGDYLFRMSLSDDKQIHFLASHMQESGIKKVALLSEQNEYATALRKAFQKEVMQKNLTLVADELYSQNDKDVRTQILKVAQSKSDAVLIIPGGAVKTTGQIIVQWYESDKNIPLYGTDQFTFGALPDDYAEYYQGMIVVQAKFDQSNLETTKLLNEYREKYGSDCSLGLFCATTYDTVTLISNAFDQCNENTECMKEFWYGVKDRRMTSGNVSIDQNGDAQFEFEYKKVVGKDLVNFYVD